VFRWWASVSTPTPIADVEISDHHPTKTSTGYAPSPIAGVTYPVRKPWLALFLCPALALAAPFTAVRDGESFTYKVGFAIFSNAGVVNISAKKDAAASGRDMICVTVETKSRGFVRGMYEFDNKAEALIEKDTSRLVSVHESGADPKRATNSDFAIDYAKRIATYTDHVRTERSREMPLPEGTDPIDLISALMQTRDWNLKPGDKRDVVVQFTRELYAITLVAEGYETISTPLGKYQTVVISPRMEKNPKGLFARGGQIKVWIAQDESHLPVKMQLELKFGSATLTLVEHKTGK
jgi:hypothetical protein